MQNREENKSVELSPEPTLLKFVGVTNIFTREKFMAPNPIQNRNLKSMTSDSPSRTKKGKKRRNESREGGRTQLINIRNKKTGITIDSTEIKIIKYYEQLYANKFDHLDEMNKFLEVHTLPTVIQEETDTVYSNKFNFQFKIFQQRKCQAPKFKGGI